ncbi:uncharacterized protein LOC135400201 [Ornithodoros turicata]|uniref:uncharacterized protein LOC135400201 n=1 Tax=Ornithodoros turicata TaxID=34597 RepID=UPI003138A882
MHGPDSSTKQRGAYAVMDPDQCAESQLSPTQDAVSPREAIYLQTRDVLEQYNRKREMDNSQIQELQDSVNSHLVHILQKIKEELEERSRANDEMVETYASNIIASLERTSALEQKIDMYDQTLKHILSLISQ